MNRKLKELLEELFSKHKNLNVTFFKNGNIQLFVREVRSDVIFREIIGYLNVFVNYVNENEALIYTTIQRTGLDNKISDMDNIKIENEDDIVNKMDAIISSFYLIFNTDFV
jgi:hypothetical protein